MKTRKASPYCRLRDDVAWREVGGVWHILTADNCYHCVEDEVGTLVLRRVEGGTSLSDLLREIESQYDAPGSDIREDVQAFLSELVQKRVIAWLPRRKGGRV